MVQFNANLMQMLSWMNCVWLFVAPCRFTWTARRRFELFFVFEKRKNKKTNKKKSKKKKKKKIFFFPFFSFSFLTFFFSKGHIVSEHETLSSLNVNDGDTIDVIVITNPSSPSSSSSIPSSTSHRDQMRQLSSNPMMRAMLSNPQTLRAVLQMNPQMQRLMQSNPDVAAMLNSDSMLQQIADAALNPETLANDRALQHIESLPGGGAALARAWQQVAEPMLDSLTPQVAEPDEIVGELDETAPFPNAWSPGSSAAANPFAAFGGGGGAVPPVNPFAAFGAGAGGGAMPPANPFAAFNSTNANPFAAMLAAQQQRAAGASPFSLPPGQALSFLNSPIAQQMLNDPAFMQSLAANNLSTFGGGTPAAETLATRFASQLSLMDDMGFTDRPRNIEALRATNGDVDAAVERIAAALEASEAESTTTASSSSPAAAAAATTTTTTSTPAATTTDPARFERQLAQLAEMGMTDREQCLNALSLSNGNVEAALERLLRDLSG
jgi:ubiquilin